MDLAQSYPGPMELEAIQHLLSMDDYQMEPELESSVMVDITELVHWAVNVTMGNGNHQFQCVSQMTRVCKKGFIFKVNSNQQKGPKGVELCCSH